MEQDVPGNIEARGATRKPYPISGSAASSYCRPASSKRRVSGPLARAGWVDGRGGAWGGRREAV